MLQLRDIDLRLLHLRTRIPFRYGITTLRQCPHLVVHATLEIDGQCQSGFAADHLPPKWFTKDPATPFEEDVREMLRVIAAAGRHGVESGKASTVFELVDAIYRRQSVWGANRGCPPLLANFGTSLIERGMIDAFCRARDVSLARAIRENRFGVEFGRVGSFLQRYSELAGTSPAAYLPGEPLAGVLARHTVGMLDPLTDGEIAVEDRVEDGLPQSLEAAIRAYGLARFKIKVPLDHEVAATRLGRVMDLVSAGAQADWRFTLDFNENFTSIEDFRRAWDHLWHALAPYWARLDFIEQPLHRDVAMSAAARADLRAWRDRPPIIIDESDGYPGAALDALDCGYAGTSHKNCKGILKGLANACVIARRRRENPGARFILSGEDLCNVGPIALNQDLAFDGAVGIENVERNGHHFMGGLGAFARAIQQQTLARHPDLYREDDRGAPVPRIAGGRMSIGSVVQAPFGVAFEPDLDELERIAT